jgi:hypothetical protein
MAQSPEVDPRLWRELAARQRTRLDGRRRRRVKRQGRLEKLVTGTTIGRGEDRESQITARGHGSADDAVSGYPAGGNR